MIKTTFTVLTKDNNCIENLNSIEDCFKYNVLKLYEVTFGKMQLLIVFNDDRKEYIFNFINGYFSVEALQQLQEYNNNNNVLYKYHAELVAREISILKGEKCFIFIGKLNKNRRNKFVSSNARKRDETTLKDILKDYEYHSLKEISLEVFSLDGVYLKAISLRKEKDKYTSSDFKWLDYLQTIDYTD